MGADPVLVKGAYDAAGNQVYQGWKHKQHQELMKIGEMVSQWDFGSGAQRVIDNNGALPQSEINKMRDELSGKMKQDYMNGDAQVQEQKLAEVQSMHDQGKEQYSQMRLKAATEYIQGNISEGYLRTPQGKDLMEMILKGKGLKKKKCPEGVDECEGKGDYGIELPDYKKISDTKNFMKFKQSEIDNLQKMYDIGAHYGDGSDLDALYEELNGLQGFLDTNPKAWNSFQTITGGMGMVDSRAISNLELARSGSYNRAFNSLPEEDIKFNREKALQTVNTTIMGKGENLQSLIYDEVIPGRTFYSDLTSHIMGSEEGGRTYADFGVTDEMIGMGDTNSDGKIDKEEADVIAQAVVNNNELAMSEVNKYFVQYIENSHNQGLNSRRDEYVPESKHVDENDLYTPQTTEQREEDNREIIERDNDRDDEYEPQSINTDYS